QPTAQYGQTDRATWSASAVRGRSASVRADRAASARGSSPSSWRSTGQRRMRPPGRPSGRPPPPGGWSRRLMPGQLPTNARTIPPPAPDACPDITISAGLIADPVDRPRKTMTSGLEFDLDRSSPVPLYFQVAEQISEAIRRG